MMSSHHWARNFVIEQQDIEHLTSLLLEKETPLDSEELARALIEERLNQETASLRERYKDARLYNPSHSYESGQKIIFPEFDYETGIIQSIRPGNNADYGDFKVIAVEFDDDDMNNPGKYREFAIDLTIPHELSQSENEGDTLNGAGELSADDVLDAAHDEIISDLEESLRDSDELIYMAKKWFPRDLLLEVNVGHLNLAEAVLDIAGGGPLTTIDILDQIGGLGSSPMALQEFSLNYALNRDSRFDEVGPAGEVLWFLTRLEPTEVQTTPTMLRYSAIDYDRSLLNPEMLALETEIADELTLTNPSQPRLDEITITIPYPHRRLGTLPLNARTAEVFPTARQTPRVYCTLVDGQDGEEYPAWVVRNEGYIFGLAKFYRKHKLPIGVYVIVRKGDEPGKIVIDFRAYKPRTEWIRLIVPKNDQISFENQKRAIGAEYDELMILGADDLAGVDALFQQAQQQKKSLTSILKTLIPPLGGLTPQGTVHAKTLYSAVNVLRRCPPGPIFATLVANPDFQNVGGDYWKLSGE
ncbi:MAG: hypothetical protein ABI690_13870 [Chloroflexota bacterium]